MESNSANSRWLHNLMVVLAVIAATSLISAALAIVAGTVVEVLVSWVLILPAAATAIVRFADRRTSVITVVVAILASLVGSIVFGTTDASSLLFVTIGWTPALATAIFVSDERRSVRETFRRFILSRKTWVIGSIVVVVGALFLWTTPPGQINCSEVQNARWPSSSATFAATEKHKDTQRQKVADAMVRCDTFAAGSIDDVFEMLGKAEESHPSDTRGNRVAEYYVGSDGLGIDSEFVQFEYNVKSREVIDVRIAQG